MSKQVYISVPATNFIRKDFYKRIGEIVSELGYEPYISHLHTTLAKNPDVTPKDAYAIYKKKIQSSCLVIVNAEKPSWDVGIELEIAASSGIPVIILYEHTAKVSKLVRGLPSVKANISYQNDKVALSYLKEQIQKINP